ncbi:hypothetical protein LTR86_004208 [Recurvomyces mirabilis]|nr:hypothetical protein LTR86_004208 [Recurvomyces mirabilis]
MAFFEPDPGAPEQEIMVYRLKLCTDSGEQLTLHGVKTLNSSAALSPQKLWYAATTLRFSVYRNKHTEVAKGVVSISKFAFARQLLSLGLQGPDFGVRGKLMLQFFRFFAQHLSKHFLAPFRPLQYPSNTPGRQQGCWVERPVPNTITTLKAVDGIASTLRMWQPSGRPADHQPRSILFLPGAAVTHEIFALPTIKKNAIEYFTEAGFRCFVLSHRLTTRAEPGPWTTYDLRLDIVAALREIQNLDGPEQRGKPYIISHCLGAMGLASALLDGTISADDVAGITASAVFLHPIVTPLNRLKARLPVLPAYTLLAGNIFSCVSASTDAFVERAINNLIRLYPQTSRRNMCTSVTCHRCQLGFGGLWSHDKLNEATHARLHNIMGSVDVRTLRHLVAMDSHEAVIDNAGRSLLTAENLSCFARLPILLFSGGENQAYPPEATRRSYQLFGEVEGHDVRHVVFPGFGHLDTWMSENP